MRCVSHTEVAMFFTYKLIDVANYWIFHVLLVVRLSRWPSAWGGENLHEPVETYRFGVAGLWGVSPLMRSSNCFSQCFCKVAKPTARWFNVQWWHCSCSHGQALSSKRFIFKSVIAMVYNLKMETPYVQHLLVLKSDVTEARNCKMLAKMYVMKLQVHSLASRFCCCKRKIGGVKDFFGAQPNSHYWVSQDNT